LLDEHDLDASERRKLAKYRNYSAKHGGGAFKILGFLLLSGFGLALLYFGVFVAVDVPLWFTGLFVVFGLVMLWITLTNYQRYRRARQIEQLFTTEPRLLLDAEDAPESDGPSADPPER